MLFLDPQSSIDGYYDALMHRNQQYILTSRPGLAFTTHPSYGIKDIVSSTSFSLHPKDHVSL